MANMQVYADNIRFTISYATSHKPLSTTILSHTQQTHPLGQEVVLVGGVSHRPVGLAGVAQQAELPAISLRKANRLLTRVEVQLRLSCHVV